MEERVIEGFRLSPQQREIVDSGVEQSLLAQGALLLEGPLDVARLGRALEAVAGRHEILRTRFQRLTSMGVPLQVIAEGAAVELSSGDAAGCEAPDVAAALEEARQRPFDLAGGAPLRASLKALPGARRLLVLTAPSLCMDARSLNNLARSIFDEYAGGAPEAPAAEPEDHVDGARGGEPRGGAEEADGADGAEEGGPIQYVQFSEWQNELGEEEDADRAKAFWQKYLDGELPALRLPLEREPSDAASGAFTPRSTGFTLDREAAARIDALLASRGLAADRYFLAAWLLFLSRAGDRADVLTRVCFDGRRFAELDDAVGLFTTGAPFRLDLDDGESAARLLDKVAFHLKDVEAYQLFYPREGSPVSAEQMALAYEYGEALAARSSGGLRVSPLARACLTERFRLKLVVERQADPVGGTAAYSCRVFYDAGRIDDGMAVVFARAIAALCRDLADRPGRPLRELRLVDDGDAQRFFRELGRGRALDASSLPFPSIAAAFAAAAARWPDRVAYVYEQHAVTYGALDRQANRVARALLLRGVTPGAPVPLFLSRGPDVLAGLLGILKAGAAFLPLDPAQPPRRMAAILDEVRSAVVVTRESLHHLLPEAHRGAVLLDGSTLDALDALDDSELDIAVGPASPAYVLFTSGSTGTPKGVVVRHDAVLNLARALQADIHDSPAAPRRCSLNANLTFDSSVKQWTRLLFGDTLIGIPEDVRADGERLRGYLESQRCQVLDCTPSQLKILLSAGLPGGLERVLLGGEAIDARLWQRLIDLGRETGRRFFNLYGPTECTVNATWTPVVEPTEGAPGRSLPVIGRPIPNAWVVLHDRHGNPVPPGFTGELLVGGAGVAAGYFRDPEKTARSFVPDPYSDRPGARLYHTGDLARFLPGGAIEFLGRADFQVKLRGLRIELGEIEAALSSHPGVKESVVLLREDRPGDQHLVAYVVPDRQGRALAEPAEAQGKERHRLPNGLAVYHQNRNETDYLYDEIFNKKTYSFYGIHLPDNAVVLDVGANIGMYSLYALQHCRSPRIYAFEPLPPIFESLSLNLRAHGERVKLFPIGLSREEASVTFTYYPRYSMMSGVSDYARPGDEVEVVKRYLEKEADAGSEGARELLRQADDLLRFRFEAESHTCRLRRLTDVLREEGIQHVDVLKVDVQRAELDVLHGLGEQDWQKIDQVVMEVHQAAGEESQDRVREITALLERHGFEVAAEQDELLAGTDRYNVYASRLGLRERSAGLAAIVPVENARAAELSDAGIRQHLEAYLPEYMIPSAVVFLDALPLSRHGKVDRRALPAPDLGTRDRKPPRTRHEAALLELWIEVLGAPHVGVDDNFFRLGGHSLLATQLMSRVRKAFDVDLPLRLLFEAPTVELLAKEIEARAGAAPASQAPPIVALPRDRPLALSFGQQRLWFIHQLEPDAAMYNNPLAFRARGPLDLDAFDRTLAAVVARHEGLRTRFVAAGQLSRQDLEALGGAAPDAAYQIIDPLAASYLEIVDLSALPEDERLARAHALRREEASAPFDLAAGPLFRAKALRLGPEDHVVLFTTHHIVNDEWSLRILAREVNAHYNALVEGRAPCLPQLPVQYADFAAWQRTWLGGEGGELARQLGYWTEALRGVPPVLNLPLDAPRTTRRSYRGKVRRFRLSPELSAALRALGERGERDERGDITPFMLFFAAFAALLHRYARQDDFCVGIPVAGRSHRETEGLIGFFINLLAIRFDLSGAPSFSDLVARTRETLLQAYAHQDLPFEKLVEKLELTRDMSHSPLFQTNFHIEDSLAVGSHLVAGDLALEGVAIDDFHDGPEQETARFELGLTIHNAGAAVAGTFRYDADLFCDETIDRMVAHFERLLAAVAADPERPLGSIPLLDDAEAQDVARASAGEAAPVDPDATLPSLFRAQVERTPDAPAVSAGGVTFTFAELDALSNRIAHALRARGVRADRPVGICVERSCALVAGILGILKAGGAYLPLDPGYPEKRIAMLLEDASPPVVLAQGATAARLPASGPDVLLLDGEAPFHLGAPASPLEPAAGPDHLAYVLYTSGSTGRPKGVMVTHRNAVNLRAALRAALYDGMGAAPLRVSVNAPVVFDSSVKQLLALLDGNCLYPVPEDVRRDAAAFVRWVAEHGIDVLDATPSMLHLLLDAGLLERPERAPRHVLLGGEAISPSLWQTLLSSRDTRFHNLYGPTECTVNATAHSLRDGDALPVIGRALRNVRVYLLDEALRPVPPGITGEIFIGGAGVSRGYLGRPALTAERFLPDPFADLPGARMYRTGDLARATARGDITFLGRADFQVKIRGHRIELGEIEAVLAGHPGVRQCVVAALPGRGQGADRLVAWVVPHAGDAVSARALRDFLAARLPEYMVPSVVRLIAEIPLTLNKKVDLAALRAEAQGAVEAPREAGRSPVEDIVVSVMADLLGASHVGLDQDFFAELGGHSLAAIQLMSRLSSALGAGLELRTIFDHPTPRRLARAAEERLRDGGLDELPPIEPAPRDQELPLSFAQGRLWLLDRMNPGSAAYNTPHAARIADELNAPALARALNELVRRHEPLRTRFPEVDARPVQVIAPFVPFELPVEDLSHLAPAEAEAEARRRAEREAALGFDLAGGPLVRFRLLRLAARDHVLLFTMHHIITDAPSLDVLWSEILGLHEAFRAGQPSPLPELGVQYADYAVWQRRWFTGEATARQLAYWKDHLRDLGVIELPLDRPRPPVETFVGGRYHFRLDRGVSDGLRRLAREHDATVFMAVLATYAAFLARVSGQEDIAVGTPVSGRGRRHTERMIGFFINTLVLRCDLSGAPSFAGLLARVREVALGAYAHQDIPFEKLVEELSPERDTSRSPLFQVCLTYLDLAPTVGAAGADGGGFDVDPNVAKFDLTLAVAHRPGAPLALSFEYRTALFDEATITRLARHFQNLLAAIVAAPGAPVCDLDLRDEAERAQMCAWNSTETDLLAEHLPGAGPRPLPCVHELVAAQAARTPDHVALVVGDERVTYAELNTRANQLAHHLRRLGVRADTVAVLADRSVDLIVALLGVLKAGAAYLPLDPAHPPKRLAFALRDARSPVLLTTSRWAAVARQAAPEARVVCLDAERPAIAREPSADPPPRATPAHLAYVLYTSGSTGEPKGVMIPHGALTSFLWSMAREFRLTERDSLLAVAAVTFDISVMDIYLPLISGARVVLARTEDASDPGALARLLEKHGATILQATPATFRMLVDAGWKGRGGLRLLCGGEALPADLAAALRERGDSVSNLYGPTEATVWVSCLRVGPDSAGSTESVFLGGPIANTTFHILDARLRPAPVGVPGELFIGGVQLARGYLNRPALTAERFLPDPFSGRPGARLYRTGDRARYRPDGTIEFLGRIDTQVKLRGLRIELGEIEAVLRAHAGVREAVVVVRQERLAAYVVPADPQAAPAAAALREHLRAQLPEYMVPSAFTFLEALPLTSSRKVDRKALPAPTEGAGRRFVHPRTPLEWQVWRIMAELLRVPSLGVNDSFFELGGHSLMAVALVGRIEALSGQKLPLTAVFRHPTVEELADLLLRGGAGGGVGGTGGDAARSPLVEIKPGAGKPPLFLVHPIGGTAFCYAALSRALDPDQPVFAFHAPGLDEGTAPLRSVDAMARVYADALEAAYPAGPVHVGGWSMGGVVAFELGRQLRARGREVAPLVVIDAAMPLHPRPERRTDMQLMLGFLGNLELSPEELGLSRDADWTLDRVLDAVLVKGKAAGVVPASADRRFLARYFEVFAAGARALDGYRPASAPADARALYDGDVLLLKAADAPPDIAQGWQRSTRGQVRAADVPGKHDQLMDPPYVDAIAARIREALA
ncbi:amino acid adenylation domain-containing protein [Sorangium sp. So ce131]|uniref:amino acid adenylation domain-containing protein n=1 Tax=Sorangium sp. So ce131 TaxID=3133282 RepID=UPI003F6336AA